MRLRTSTLVNKTRVWQHDSIAETGGDCTDAPVQQATVTVTGNQSSEYHYESMEDVETANFYKIRANGGIVNSPMVKTVIVSESLPALINQGYTGWSYGCVPDPFWYNSYNYSRSGTFDPVKFFTDKGIEYFIPNDDQNDVERLKSLAITDAWARIGHHEVMTLVSGAELGKTVDGITGLLKKVLRITTSVKRKDLKGFRNSMGDLKRDVSFDDLSDIYMQARYGLRPLYYELRGLLKAMKTDLSLPGGNRFTFRGHSSDSFTGSSESEHLIASSSFNYQAYVTLYKTMSLDTNVRAGVLTELDQLTANKLGGVSLIAESAFELVPYSFIAGWFCNVAQLISSWAPNMGSRTLASWVTVDETMTQSTTVGGTRIVYNPTSSKKATDAYYNITGQFSKTTYVKSRTPEPSRPILPVFRLNLDPLKLLDLGFIGRGLLKNAKYAKQLRL